MSFTKVFIPSLANEVGLMAASMLSHIKYWSETSGKDKIFRTNKELSDDFEGALSPSQIQRCKQKLIDKGYITTSYDKCYDRTTHYMLTEKAKSLFASVSEKAKKVVEVVVNEVKKPVAKAKEYVNKWSKPKQEVPVDSRISDTEVKVDGHNPIRGFDLLAALGKKKKDVVQEENLVDICEDEEDCNINSDDYFAAIDIAMATAQERSMQTILEQQATFDTSSGVSVFKRIPNIDILENNRKLKEESMLFSEDY